MTKDEVLGYLRAEGIDYRLVEHRAVSTMDEVLSGGLPHPELIAKNLFVRDDKKRDCYSRSDKALVLRDFGRAHGTRRLSLASEDIMKYLGLDKGSVTPLGFLNDDGRKAGLVLDRWSEGKETGIHPMANTSTVFFPSSALIAGHGNRVSWL